MTDGTDDATHAAEARRLVLSQEVWILDEADNVLGREGAAAAEIKAGRLVAVDDDGDMLIPDFQLDGPAGVVRPVVAKLNVILGALGDPWGVALWWVTPHDWLEAGRTPAMAGVQNPVNAVLERMAQPSGDGPAMLPGIPLSVDDVRIHLASLQYERGGLPSGERELLAISQALLRLLDRHAQSGA